MAYAPVDILPRRRVCEPLVPDASSLAAPQFDIERADDFPCNFVLQIEDIVQYPIISLAPYHPPIRNVGHLYADPDAVSPALNRAFDHVADIHFLANLEGGDLLSAISLNRAGV